MILNEIRMEIGKRGKLPDSEVKSQQVQIHSFPFEFWTGHVVFAWTYTKKLFIAYLKFRFKWASCIFSGSPTRRFIVEDNFMIAMMKGSKDVLHRGNGLRMPVKQE